MQNNKTFVNSNNTAIITCPKCKKARSIDAAGYKNRKHTIAVRCSCQHTFETLLDFRKHFRKETNLEGSYVMVPPAVGSGMLCILNISKQGVGFTIGFSVKGSNTIVPGQKINLTFQLDDKKRTTLEKTIMVRTVNDQYVGGEFEVTQAYDKDLGFYLLSGS